MQTLFSSGENLLFLSTLIVFFIFLIRNTLFWLHLWQIKEYRLDRLLIHLRETSQGRNLLVGWENITKLTIFFLYFVTIFYVSIFNIYPFLVFLVYFFSVIRLIQDIQNKRIKFPAFTARTSAILLLVLSLELFLLTVPLLDKFFWLLFLDKLLPFVIAALIGIFSIPSDFYKDIIINRAIEKLSAHKNLLVIGITGSYGKGSTKEFLATILAYKFSIFRTLGTFNTPIGIAKTVLADLSFQKKIFIAEMGAYKRGEIAEMCSMIKPKIGILTSVNNQHISLFGSFEKTMRAKYELIESLKRNSLSLFNGNNENSLTLYQKTSSKKLKKILYFADYEGRGDVNADIMANNIKVGKFSLSFDVSIDNRKIGSFVAKLVGKQNVENLLPGIFFGLHFGMNKSEIKAAVAKIKPLKKTMKPYVNSRGVVLIDDTYNANPASVLAAVEYMKIYKRRKVLVLQPMIELGRNAKQDHYTVAKKIGEVCDYLILTNKNFPTPIDKGINDGGGKCELLVSSAPRKTAQFIEENLKRGDVVVFEGKEAEASLSLLPHQEVD